MKQKILLLLLMLMGLSGSLGLNAQNSTKEAYAVRNGSTLTFYYDNQRNSRTGTTYDMNTGVDYPGWYENRSTITNVVFDTSFTDARPTCCDYWFEDMSNLASISGLNYLNTSSVTSMEWMFGGCSKLTSLNVSGFNTENVQNMTGMFGGCSKLTSLDVSRFKTEKVLGMGSMFSSCTSLSSLDVSRFNTGQVVNTSYMFFGCENITTIDVSDWDVSHVETMMNMFDGCKKLSSLDLSSFVFSPGPEPDVSSNEYYKWMLADCTGLQTLIVPASAGNLPAGACEGVGTQSAPCTLIYPSGFTPEKDEIGNGWYWWKGGYFKDGPKPYAALSWDKTTLTFYCDTESTSRIGSIYDMNTGNNVPRWYNSRTNVTTVVFDPSFANARPSSCFSWFAMPHLNSITGLEYLNTSAVTDMEQMFTGCPLESIDVSHFNTANVTTMDGMFYGCANLKSIDVSGFNTNKMNDPDTGIISMFTSCTSLTSLDLSSFTFYTVANTASMLSNCTSLQKLTIPATAKELNANACSGVGMQDAPCTLVYPNGFTPEKTATGDGWYKWKSGYFKDAGPEPYAVLDGSTLTFYYDANYPTIPGTVYELNTGETFPGWFYNNTSVEYAVFDPSFAAARPTTCYCWFANLVNLTTITGIEYLNTEEVTSMRSMFNGCTKLSSLDVSGFNTSKVTDISSMFCECSSLTSLDVSGFDTSSATDMVSMFQGCSSLTSLDLSGFDTSNVTDMQSMFRYCSSLTSLDLSTFDTSKVTYLICMFDDCSSLTNLNVRGFNTENATIIDYMFSDCSSLTSLDLSSFTFNSGISTSKMLENCSGLTRLTIPATANNIDADACNGVGSSMTPCGLATPDGSIPQSAEQQTDYFTWKGGYFKLADPEPYAVLNGTTLSFYYDMKRAVRNGTTYDLNTGNNEPGWNANASSVTSVVFDSSFADARPTSCFCWFLGMNNLTTITDIGNLKTDEVTTMYGMFFDCSSLTTLDVSGFNTSKVTSMQMMFASCSGLTTLDVSLFDTSKVTSMASMFDFCSGLTSLDVSGFDTSNVIFLGAMFFYCSSLTSLDVSGFNTANVTNMGSMFHSCSGLTSLDVSEFVTSKVTDMGCMFYGCSGLTSLDVSGFNTSKVNSMGGMFMDCSGLTSLDLSNFTLNSTASGTYNYMLQHCSGLQTLTIPANADRLGNDACQGVGTQSAPCALIYPVGFTPEKTATGDGWYQWKSGYFKDAPMPYAELSPDNTTLTFYFDDQRSSRTGTTYDLNTENNTPGWYAYRTSVTTVVFDPSFADARPSSCFSWFVMFNLNSITGLEYLNTSAVTNMMQMFMGCPLESIDVSHFNTANVTAMEGMFYQCSNLKSIDLSSFNTNRVDDPYGGFNLMFSNCTSLTNLDLSNFTFASVASTDYMLYGCSGLQKLAIPATATELSADACSGVGTRSAPCSLVYPDGFTPEKTATGDGWYRWKGGYFKDAVVEPYAVLSTDQTTLTFCYDKQKGLRPGTSYDLNDGESTPGWYIYASHVTNVDFNFAFQNARPTSCYMWFSNMTNLTTIEHLDYLNTSEVTDMRYMFQRCLKLTSLDISTFDTEKVTNMAYMFDECTSLETLTGLSSFHTSNVTSMYAMFQNCSSLTELKGVNCFNMSNVFTNGYMFKGCSSLKRLLLGHFRIPIINDEMMAGCTSLQTLFIIPSGHELDSGACTGVGTKKAPCTLVTEDPSTITHDESYDGYFKWRGGYFKDAVDEPYAAFAGTTLTFLYDKWRTIAENEDETFDMEPRLGIPKWLAKVNDIKYVVFTPSFAEARPTSCASWFYNMTQLVGIINLSYLNTSEVTNMFYMFGNCKMLTSLNVSSFNTANVTNMEGMFNGCSGLTSINVSGLNTANVTTMETMFFGCSSLTSLDVSGLNTANVKRMQNMFYKCSSLTSLDVSGFNTEKVINMDGMFSNCSNLTSVNVSGFNTQNTTYMGGMFNNCTSLTSLDLSSFTIPLNGYWSTMMKNCTSLQTLTVPATAGNLPAGACEGVGTQSAPCTLIYPSGFTPEKDEIGNGWYKWKSGYFKDRAFPLGDVNHDGEVTILDVTLLVDHLLSKNPSPFYTENADVNSDQDITITDVTALVNILLHQSASHAPATAREATFDRLWLTTDGNHCLLHLDTPERYTAMHLTLRLPEGGALGNVRFSSSRSAGHHVETRALGDGLYNVVLCASDNAELRSDVTELLHFDLAGCQPQDVEVVAVQSTNRLYETIMSGGMTTGIEVVEVSDDSDGDGYNTVGVRVGKNARGVVIRNGRKKVEN